MMRREDVVQGRGVWQSVEVASAWCPGGRMIGDMSLTFMADICIASLPLYLLDLWLWLNYVFYVSISSALKWEDRNYTYPHWRNMQAIRNAWPLLDISIIHMHAHTCTCSHRGQFWQSVSGWVSYHGSGTSWYSLFQYVSPIFFSCYSR